MFSLVKADENKTKLHYLKIATCYFCKAQTKLKLNAKHTKKTWKQCQVKSHQKSCSKPNSLPEARPIMEYRWDGTTPLPYGLQFGSTSRSAQSIIGNVSQLQIPPQSFSPSPAYCFHCMQYGPVFTINTL